MFCHNAAGGFTRLIIGASLFAPLIASAEISTEEARAGFVDAITPATPRPAESPAPRLKERPLFTPPDALSESSVESRPGQYVVGRRKESDGGGFLEFDAGYAATTGSVSGIGIRSDLAGAFAHDMGGVTLASGMDFGFGRLGASAGYYADHAPWGLALAGEIIGVAAVVAGHGNPGGLDKLPDPYYRLRTELSTMPFSVYYEQAIPLPGRAGEFRFGPLVGGTVNLVSANYAQGEHTDGAIAFHYGARAALDFKIETGIRLRIGYEYRHMSATDYDLGFALHMAPRDTHTVLLGVTALF